MIRVADHAADGASINGSHRSRAGDGRLTVAIVFALVVAVAVSFAPVLSNGFVNFDDDYNFEKNPNLSAPFWPQLEWASTTFYLGAYQPLFWMLAGLECRLFGLSPRAFHLVSVLLHAGVVVTFYFVIVALLDRFEPTVTPAARRSRRLGAAIAAALFGVHPLRVEVVAWATNQSYLLCALCALLTILAYLRAHPAGRPCRPRWLVASLGLFVASLLAHATSIGLPVALLALDTYPLQRLGSRDTARRALLEKWPFLLATAVFALLGFAAKQDSGSLTGIENLGLSARLATAAYGTCFYLAKTAVPWGLHVYYMIPPRIGLNAGKFVAAALGVVALTLAAVACRKRWPGLLAGWIGYLALLAPSSGLVTFSGQIAADKYSYLPLMSLFAVAGFALSRSAGSRPRTVIVLALAALLALGLAARAQCRTWRDSETLWSRALRLGDPANVLARHNLALALSARGEHAAALRQLEQAARVRPREARVWYAMGVELFSMDRVPEAIEHYRRAIAIDPNDVDARVNLAQALAAAGKPREALAEYRALVERHPELVLAHWRLGVALAEQGAFAESRDQLLEAVRLEPDSADARLALGRVLAELGQLKQAASHLSEAVRLRPDSPASRFALGLVLADLGRRQEAAYQFRAVLRLRPGDEAARDELARALR